MQGVPGNPGEPGLKGDKVIWIFLLLACVCAACDGCLLLLSSSSQSYAKTPGMLVLGCGQCWYERIMILPKFGRNCKHEVNLVPVLAIDISLFN